MPKSPTSEALDMEKTDDDEDEDPAGYLAIRRFTTLPTISGNIIHTDHLESH